MQRIYSFKQNTNNSFKELIPSKKENVDKKKRRKWKMGIENDCQCHSDQWNLRAAVCAE